MLKKNRFVRRYGNKADWEGFISVKLLKVALCIIADWARRVEGGDEQVKGLLLHGCEVALEADLICAMRFSGVQVSCEGEL